MTSIMKKAPGHAGMPAAPFGGLVDSIFQNNLSRFFDDDFWGLGSMGRRAGVPVNIRETGQSYELELMAPGLRKEDFKIQISDDMLNISMEQQNEQSQESREQGWIRREFRMQSFSRSFKLDDTVDANSIAARYQDGILQLVLPKKEGARKLSRTIEIQ